MKRIEMKKNKIIVAIMIICLVSGILGHINVLYADNQIIQGQDGDLKWSLDSYGHLEISGKGNYKGVYMVNHEDEMEYMPQWYSYHDDIKSATVKVTDITNTAYLFSECVNMKSVDLSHMNTSKVTTMKRMFSHCESLTTLDLSSFNTSKVTDMSDMFSGCSKVRSFDLSTFQTGNVTTMLGMFYNCASVISLDCSAFNTGKVEYMGSMFYGCQALNTLDLSSFNCKSLKDADSMLTFCENLDCIQTPYNLSMSVELPYGKNWYNPVNEILDELPMRTESSVEIKTSVISEIKPSVTSEITYLAMSELAYCQCSSTNGKTIKESGDLEKYIKSQQTSSPNTLISNAHLNLTNKQFIEILFKYIEDWKIVDTYEDEFSGFYAVALEKDGKHVFAIRGSQDIFNTYNQKTDWLDNVTYGLFEQTSKQMMNALYFASFDKEKYSVTDDNYTITGHSLGGGLGDLAGNFLGVKAVTFDGSPTTDVSYYRLPEFMSFNFKGVNKWDSMDYVNENCPIGNLELNMKKYTLLADRNTSSHSLEAHQRWAMVDYDLFNDCLSLSPETGSNATAFSANSILRKDIHRIYPTVISDAAKAINNTHVYNVLKSIGETTKTGRAIGRVIDFTSKLNKVFPKGTLYLGGSDSQFISASLKLNNIHTDVVYGGDGNDKIYGFYGDDYLIGGNGDDTLDGGDGDDKYYHWKGQGTDTIIDESGNDTLYLYGYNDDDVITFESDSKYIYVKNNAQTIITISKMRNPSSVTNSFDVIIYKENEIKQERLQDWNCWKNVRAITIACPTKVQVYDKEDNLVLELEDELDEPIYTEFGQFYVSNEEGELVKHLLLEDTYKVKVIATDDGTMNFASHQDDGSILEVISAEDIPINEGEEYNIDLAGDVSLKKDGNDISLKKTSIVKATDITVNKANIEINKGETYQISANIIPANSTEVLNYESLNSSIATVDSKGRMTAIEKGECVITVYTESGVSTNIIVKVKEENDKTTTDNATINENRTTTDDATINESEVTTDNATINENKVTTDNATINESEVTTDNVTINENKVITDNTITTGKKATNVKKPAKAKIKKVAIKKKSARKVRITLKKINAKGYQVVIYKTKKDAKKNKKAIVKKIVRKTNATKVTVISKKLKNRKTLFVRVCAYNLDGKKKVYGKWSTVKEVKLKK